MKNLSKIISVFALGVFTITSCDEPVDDTSFTPDGDALMATMDLNREEATQNFTVDLGAPAGTGPSVVGEQGTTIYFYPGSVVDGSGNIITGVIDVELIEIFSKSDMLLLNKPTVGVLPSGDHAMLVSGGEFKLTASQAGEELFVNGSISFDVVASNTGGFDSDMVLFSTELDCCNDCDGIDVVCDENVFVLEDDSTGQGGVWVNSLGDYGGAIDSFQWTNIDRFYNDPAPKTTILVEAPGEYDESNLGIYLSVDGEPNLLATLDTYIEADGLFSEHYGQMPIGLDVHIIAISMVDDEYYYTIKGATITDGAIIVLDALTPITEASLSTEINSLP